MSEAELTLTLDAETRARLKNFAPINPSMLFRPGNMLRTTSPDEDVVGFAKIETTIPAQFAIYDLENFLSVLRLFDNPKIIIGKEHLTISENGEQFLYGLISPDLIMSPSERSQALLEKGVRDTELANFVLPLDTLKKLKTLCKIDGNNFQMVRLVSDGAAIYVKQHHPAGGVYQYSILLIAKDAPRFDIKFDVKKFNVLSDEEYALTLAKNITLFSGKDVKYFVAPEAGSTYE